MSGRDHGTDTQRRTTMMYKVFSEFSMAKVFDASTPDELVAAVNRAIELSPTGKAIVQKDSVQHED